VVIEETLPRALGPYVLLARIGRGGMGDVYVARHGSVSGFEKHCVLKMLRDDRIHDPELLARFAEEARVVIQLSHRNICPVFDVGRVGDRLYVVLEHIIGRDLLSIAQLRPVPLAIALHVVGEVCEALDYAHRFVDRKTGAPLGLVHRDVSPHNVMLGEGGDTKLIDFGIATTQASVESTMTEILGKLTYMAPEQARGEPVDHRADQFSTAVMLTELLLSQRFYEGLSVEVVHRLVGEGRYRPSRLASAIDPGLVAIIERALAPATADRWPSMAHFADALQAWATHHGAIATARDVRRHVLAVCGDLAAEHRALLRQLDEQLMPGTALEPTQTAQTEPDGPFESIATTLAAPTGATSTSTSTFSQPPVTEVATGRRRRTAHQPRSRVWLPALTASLGLLAGIVVTSLTARPAAVVVDVPLPEVEAPTTTAAPTTTTAAPTTTTAAPTTTTAAPTTTTAAPTTTTTTTTTQPAANGQRRPGLDNETQRWLSVLRACTEKVACARGLLEWSSRPSLSATERVELKDAAANCVKRCRLK
jgi:serine/threonine protein kinase